MSEDIYKLNLGPAEVFVDDDGEPETRAAVLGDEANAIARADVDPDSFPRDVLVTFRAAARRLDAAEKELLAAREAAAAAVGRLREEAVK